MELSTIGYSRICISKRKKKRLSKKKQEELFSILKRFIDQGNTSILKLSHEIGKSTRQTRRYINIMANRGMVKLNPETRLLVKANVSSYESLPKNEFANIPEIAKWINDCIARDVKPDTISQYVKCVKSALTLAKVTPRQVIKSKKDAVEIWAKFMVEFRRKNPARGTQYYRVSFKNFLASFDITFAPRMGKIYGLSSAHDKHGAYAGVSLSPEITKKIGDMILANDDLQLYTWWRIGLRTGARSSAIATMTWERVYFNEKNEDGSESFKLEQHETKDPRGHFHLGNNGEWKTKYPPLDLKELLLRWKQESGLNSKFVWFKDGFTDAQNRRNSDRVKERISKKLRMYFTRISDEVDPLTREYMFKKPSHLMRHTLAQQMKDGGMTNEEIADAFGWRSPEIVGTWYSKTSEKKKKELGLRCSKVLFGYNLHEKSELLMQVRTF